jgi:hypothetical protein
MRATYSVHLNSMFSSPKQYLIKSKYKEPLYYATSFKSVLFPKQLKL